MSSPDRMEMLAAAVARLVEAMRLMDANQTERDQWLLESDRRLEEINVRIREHHARIEENNVRIREIIALLTEMQSDITRLDAAS